MVKSGIIIGAIAFIYLLVTNTVAMPCTICEVILLGIFAGLLAAIFDKPQNGKKAAVSGGAAGFISGICAVLGNIIGFLIRSFVLFTPETLTNAGGQLVGTTYSSSESLLYTFLTLGCCIIVDLIFMVGLGALGGFLWFQYRDKNTAPPPQVIS